MAIVQGGAIILLALSGSGDPRSTLPPELRDLVEVRLVSDEYTNDYADLRERLALIVPIDVHDVGKIRFELDLKVDDPPPSEGQEESS